SDVERSAKERQAAPGDIAWRADRARGAGRKRKETLLGRAQRAYDHQRRHYQERFRKRLPRAMRLLLDTHAWIWAQESPEKFGRRARALLEDISNSVSVSAIAALEIARLIFLRRIQLAESASAWIADSVRSLGAQSMNVNPKIAAEAYKLPANFHKDSVDRVLVATARVHNLTLITADELILRYPLVNTMRTNSKRLLN